MRLKIVFFFIVTLAALNSFAMTNETISLSYDGNNNSWISQPSATLVFPMSEAVVDELSKLGRGEYLCRGKANIMVFNGGRMVKQIFALSSCKEY